jgi:hypothetical protein
MTSDEQLAGLLGQAVVAVWSDLPRAIQEKLFEKAAGAQADEVRERLAKLLHAHHERTSDGIGKPRQPPEPDSLGG